MSTDQSNTSISPTHSYSFLGVYIPIFSNTINSYQKTSIQPSQSDPSIHQCSDPVSLDSSIIFKGDIITSEQSRSSSKPHSGSNHSSINSSMLNQLLPSRFPASQPSDLRSDHHSSNLHHPSSSSTYALENPLVIRNLIRRFSPPFKPFGSTEILETDLHHPDLPSSSLSTRKPSMSLHFPKPDHVASANLSPIPSSSKRLSHHRLSSNHHDSISKRNSDGKPRTSTSLENQSYPQDDEDQPRSRRNPKSYQSSQLSTFIIGSDEEPAIPKDFYDWPEDWDQTQANPKQETSKKKIKRQKSQTLESNKPRLSKTQSTTTLETIPQSDRTLQKRSHQEKRRRPSQDSDGSNFDPQIDDEKENGIQDQDDESVELHHDHHTTSRSNRQDSPGQLPSGEPTAASTSSARRPTLSGTSDEDVTYLTSNSRQNEKPNHSNSNHHLDEQDSEDEPPKKQPKPKRPKAAVEKSPKLGNDPHDPSPTAGPSKPVYRIPNIIPACEPDDFGQYESSTCHQCRVKTTRPKMICDQSQDPNCVVRVCITCLMTREVYDDHPELRPPIFKFVPGGTMLCVKCRNLCPCASCRRRRGEKEQCRRGLGGSTKGFYGLTPEEREQALTKKKEKQELIRQKKESRPAVEKKTPVVCRREAAAIRHTGFDDDIEQERLQHWAPLPVFPPLPPARKKKRKRLDATTPIDCKTGDSVSESSCSDTDTNEESDTDSISISSELSRDFHPGNNTVLDPTTFKLSLSSSHSQRRLSISNRWRSNNNNNHRQDLSSESLYRSVKRKNKNHRAPIVWIKGGAIVQARKPPTKEFMDKLAEEQKSRSSGASTVMDEDDDLQNRLHQHEIELSNETAIGNLTLGDIDVPAASLPVLFGGIEKPMTDEQIPSPLAFVGDPSKVDWLPSFEPTAELYGPLTPDTTMQEIQVLPNPTNLNASCNPFRSQSTLNPITTDNHPRSDLPMASTSTSHLPNPQLIQASSHHNTENPIKPHPASNPNGLHCFESDTTSFDHQAYLSSLTNEELRDVLKQGNYEMAKQGFLPPMNESHSNLNLNHHHHHRGGNGEEGNDEYDRITGISPELISASLPKESTSRSLESDLKEKNRVVEVEGEGGALGLNELNEEDQQIRLIEAANWAAVWGATDGFGGFNLTSSNPSTSNSNSNSNNNNLNSSNHSNHSNNWQIDGKEKEVFLKAFRNSVGDEWLTDVMSLDSF
ncbi:uncharacterized protein MELLADRAFT_78215 [Melampsora larici-populina 98AG31]|uniref:Zinc-finger domain-containing protein n=1 Tax=Melampsora larici-populina (strain 98AG31 / pathotype 3-4-7) TaxID=747676 RepID=F4RRL2_MELLP|nr:uncharacterized protein MELLADRAFT_78215 [Melampsora larici-populina 98AG31]EGG05004.1 hypothetical protein MELLADRAFT_78215 [Melampsora larici-populina 98AG31]